MPLDALDQKTLNSLPRLSEVYDAYGVQVNALSVNEIFALYERTGFLYPDKAARLLPHLGQVRENWRRMLRGGDSLLYVLTSGDKKSGLASIAVWRTTHHGWTSQHLVSENNPMASRAVMLAGTAASILRGVDESHQNWFRPENRFPSRVFGSMVQTIGQSLSSVQRHMYFALPRNSSLPSDGKVRIVPYDRSHEDALSLIASVARGSIYVTAEQLTTDPELTEVDELYREVGLRRTRRVWLAYRGYKDEPIGAAIASASSSTAFLLSAIVEESRDPPRGPLWPASLPPRSGQNRHTAPARSTAPGCAPQRGADGCWVCLGAWKAGSWRRPA